MLISIVTVLTLGYFCILTEACSPGDADGSGVELLGTYYNCKYLRDYYLEDEYIGIYKERRFHCGMPYTDCCQTCNEILRCKDAPFDGIYLAETYYSCSFLQKYHPDDERVGIYKNRRFICNQTTTDCCESCEKVLAESKIPTTPRKTTAATTITTIPRSTGIVTPEEYIDTCDNSCLWVGDGSYGKCSWLLDPARSVYKSRKALCNGLAPGCKRTCHIISMESENTRTTDRGSSVTTTPTPVCKDTYLMVKKRTYTCSDLLNPNSDIYNNRQSLCSSDSRACCGTCQRVRNEKQAGVIKYSDQNMIDKNGIVIETLPSAAKTNSNQGNILQSAYNVPSNNGQKKQPPQQSGLRKGFVSFYDIIKGSLERMQKQEETRRNVFTSLMANILSTFKRLQQKS